MTRRQSPLPYLTGLTLLLMLVGTLNYHIGPLVKPPYRAATAYVADHVAPGEIVLHTSDGAYLPALRYAPQLTQGLLDGDPDPRKPEAVYQALGGQVWTLDEMMAQQNGRFWLVVAIEHSETWQLTQKDTISSTYRLLDKQAIGGIQIYYFGEK